MFVCIGYKHVWEVVGECDVSLTFSHVGWVLDSYYDRLYFLCCLG